MFKKYRPYFEVILILLLGLVSQIWFKKGHLLISVDTFLPIKLGTFINEYLHVWSWKTAFGFADVNKLPFLVPLGILLKFYETLKLPFSPIIFQRLLTYFLFAGSGVSLYFLFRTSFPRASSPSRLVASLLYMFNFYTMFIFFALPYPLLFSYAFFPFVFSLYIKWLGSTKRVSRPLALALVWFALLTPSYMTPPYLLIHFFILLAFSVFWIFVDHKRGERIRQVIWFNGLFLVFWLLLNCFWLLPLAFSLKDQLTSYALLLGIKSTELFSLNSVRVLEAFRLRGYFGFTDSYKGESFYPWFKFYENNPFFEVLSFTVPLLAFLWLLSGGRKNRRALFFSVFTLIFIGLAKGVNPPFGFFNKFIFFRPPLTTVFRSVYQRFTGYIALGLAVLAGYTFDCLFRTKRPILFLSFLVLICGVYVWPLWNGELFSSEGIFPSKHTVIPDYYFQASEWLGEQGSDFNILLLPFNRLGLAVCLWDGGKEGYGGVEPLSSLSGSRFAYSGGGLGDKLAAGLVSGEWGTARPLLPFNFRYILVKNDTHWDYIAGNSFWVGGDRDLITESLSKIEGIGKPVSFGELDFYKVDDDYFLPHFYISEKTFYIDGDFEVFSAIADLGIFGARPGVHLDTGILGRTDGILVQAKGPLGLSISEAGWREWWSWPEAGVNPMSWKYLLVRLKEWWIEKRKADTIDKADTLFWHGMKRVEEMKKWGGEATRYEKKVRAAIELLRTVPEEERDERFWQLVEKFRVYIERVEEEVKNSEGLSKANSKLRACVDEIAGPRCSEGELCYRVAVPEEGKYEVLAGGEDVELLEETPFGEASFGAGKQVLKFKVSEPENLVPEEDSGNRPTFYERISEWEYGKKYRISFDYKIGNEEVRLFVKLAKRGKGEDTISLRPVGEVRGSGVEEAGWRHFEEIVEADHGAEEVGLYLYTTAGKDLETGEFKNVTVRRIPEPRVVLRKLGNSDIREIPKITFARVNPAKYRVRVEGAKEPYTLVFNEGFHRGWKVYMNKSPIDADHLLVNGYANSWYIEPEDVGGAENYELIVEFWPQRLFHIGLLISGIALIGCVGCLAVVAGKRK